MSSEVPSGFALQQNYPNPFNPVTKIVYQIPKNTFVTIKIFDALGKEIETIVNENHSPGTYEVEWNAGNNPSGIYFYKLISESFVETKKMILLK
ncbi:MAG: T9SS type A sorting domain-containing protein [Ignavibacteria bacterium]|nr:T9SS type A sorting domain-containing protein [Ignavibacteria bacterium]